MAPLGPPVTHSLNMVSLERLRTKKAVVKIPRLNWPFFFGIGSAFTFLLGAMKPQTIDWPDLARVATITGVGFHIPTLHPPLSLSPPSHNFSSPPPSSSTGTGGAPVGFRGCWIALRSFLARWVCLSALGIFYQGHCNWVVGLPY